MLVLYIWLLLCYCNIYLQPDYLCFLLIFNYNLQVLLVTSRKDPSLWIVPGGGIEPDEAAACAAVREVQEEAGVIGNLGRCLGVFEVSFIFIALNIYFLIFIIISLLVHYLCVNLSIYFFNVFCGRTFIGVHSDISCPQNIKIYLGYVILIFFYTWVFNRISNASLNLECWFRWISVNLLFFFFFSSWYCPLCSRLLFARRMQIGCIVRVCLFLLSLMNSRTGMSHAPLVSTNYHFFH